MAAPSGQQKVARYFLALVIIIASLYALVFLTGTKKPHPKLGLDLQGGSSLTLSALTPDGKDPNPDSLEQARSIIANRVDSSGVTEPEVITEGKRNIVVNVAGGASRDELKKLVSPAKLAFRKVLSTTQDHPVTTPLPADACGATLPGATSSASPSASASGSAAPSASGSAAPSASGSAAPSASASHSPSPSPSSASPSPSPSGSASPTPSLNASQKAIQDAKDKALASAKAKLGPAYDLAQSIQDPSQVDAATLAGLAPFANLTCTEVAALPPAIQFLVPTVSCAELNARDPGAIDAANEQVVACDQGENVHSKYYLDVAKVQGTDVSGADANYDTNNGGWNVKLHFTSAGQPKWTALTQEATQNGDQSQTGQSQNAQVAIVLDNEVVSAPQIQNVIVGDAVINGTGINDVTSKTLATQLKYGSLPLNFKEENFQNVTATLGLQQLGFGLLAGAIGLILVILYCLFYYRALGLVVIASLGVSGTVIFAALVLLGRYIGFTLSLAGIAGFIVAIGITADSFVVYFERLKDEVKDGRTVRSAVPRAWKRARRTILSADAVSFLAAAILYLLAAGPVKGFAFTLGLSTIIDLLVVFLFTYPLVALLSRSSAFTSPRVSGLGNARSDKAIEAAAAKAPRFGAIRTKES